MNIEQVREYTLSLPGVTEDQPFGEEMTLKDSEEKVYIPAIKDCIKQIDIENHKIIIHVMEGLLN